MFSPLKSIFHRRKDTVPPPQPTESNTELEDKAKSGTHSNSDITVPYRLGRWTATILILGWVIEFLILAFLLYLWGGSDSTERANNTMAFWRWIMLQRYAAQATTLSSLVLRGVIDLQATICTALVASLMLEGRDVLISEVAFFSVVRAVNGGPYDLAEKLAKTPKKFFRSLPAFMLLLLLITALASQLTSTLLLADFKDVALLDNSIFVQTPIIEAQPELLFPPANSTNMVSQAWREAPASYAPFAEILTEDAETGDDIYDTGNIKRAFLPFNSPQRASIRQYDGAAITMDSRVSCTRPSIVGALQYVPGRLGAYWPRIVGKASWNSLPSWSHSSCFPGTTKCDSIPFDCAVPFVQNDTNTTWILPKKPTTLCLFNETDQSLKFQRSFSNIFLALNTAANATDVMNFGVTSGPGGTDADVTAMIANFSGPLYGPSVPDPASNGEWSSYEFSPENVFNFTVCQSAFQIDLENITSDSANSTREPTLNFDSSTRSWLTEGILRLMGVGVHRDDASRGILKITNSTKLTDAEIQEMFPSSINFEYLSSLGIGTVFSNQFIIQMVHKVKGGVLTSQGPQNFSVYFCPSCDLNGDFFDPNPSFSTLFQAALEETGSVAPAYQSVLFWLAQAQYYRALPGFDFGTNSSIVYAKTVSIPDSWIGLTGVIVILLVNMTCVVVISWLFLHRTRHSIYGDIWHTIAQIVSPDTRHLIDRATRSADDDVKRILKEAGSSKMSAGLYRMQSGRVVVLRNNAPFRHIGVD